jgi:hypothetical protein
MIKELQYKGYATEPSDYECPDGQLAASLNLISEDNQLKPVFQPAARCVMPQGMTVVFIHQNYTFRNYIIHDHAGGRLLWMEAGQIDNAQSRPVDADTITQILSNDSPTHVIITLDGQDIHGFEAVGNTIIILASDGMHYVLWKSTAEGYIHLGTHLPELPISFGLQGMISVSERYHHNWSTAGEGWGTGAFYSKLDDKYKLTRDAITAAVLAKVNKIIADEATKKGRFIFPFLIRYALRLYDGSLTMQSNPVLMLPTTDSPVGCIVEDLNGGSDSQMWYRVFATAAMLDFQPLSQMKINEVKNWKDIIKSIDIFVSKPIYTYDQAGAINQIEFSWKFPGFSLAKVSGTAWDNEQGIHYPNRPDGTQVVYAKISTEQLLKEWFTMNTNVTSKAGRTNTEYAALIGTEGGETAPGTSLSLWENYEGKAVIPMHSKEHVAEQIENCSSFYLLKQIPVEELTTARKDVRLEEEYLTSLEARETLPDGYDSHDTLMPTIAYTYNARLNLANITKSLFSGFQPSAAHPFQQDTEEAAYSTFIFIRKQGKEIVVASQTSELRQPYGVPYFFHPDTDAYRAVMFFGLNRCYDIRLKPHPTLNGAVAVSIWEGPQTSQYSDGTQSPQPPAQSDDINVTIPNKIYTSEVNNPFIFPVTAINTVGTGTVLGISAAAKALSQGQFGQFPLYAFTTDGVWALEVSATGSYDARQPITRDVCISTGSITQLDSAVLFATDRGIMLISGSQTQCITDSIFAEQPFNVLNLPCIDQLHTKIGHSADACLPTKPFLGFLAGCQMVYDYVHQRIFVFNPATETVNGVTTPLYTYAYVFSLKSKMWGMTFSSLKSTINSYPDALAMTHDNKLVSFSETDEQVCKGLYITRPLKLEAADVHKTISALIQRGHFQRGDVGTVLYGSRDLYTWHLIWSSKDHYLRGFRGTPYKYFRIAGIATLTDDKSIFGASVNFGPRHTNQLR